MEKARPRQSAYRERTFKCMDIVSASEMICQRESAPPQDRERHPARTQLLGFATGSGNSQGKGHPGNQRPGILQPRPMTGQEKHSPPRHPAMGISGQTDTGRERTSDSPTDSPGTATPHKSTLGNKRLPPATVNEPQTSDSNRNHAPGTRQEKKIPKGQAPLRER